MNVEYLIQLLTNKLTTLQNSKANAFMAGDTQYLNSIDQEIFDTTNTLNKLKLLQAIDATALATNTTSANVVETAIANATGVLPTPNPDAVAELANYDLSTYATDPLYQEKLANILHLIPPLTTPDGIDAYIKSVVPASPVTGAMIYDASVASAIDPRVLTAILQLESQFGTIGVGAGTLNPGNVGNTDSGATQTYSSWSAGVAVVAQWLSNHRAGSTPPPPAVVIPPPVVSPPPVVPAPVPAPEPVAPTPAVIPPLATTTEATSTPATPEPPVLSVDTSVASSTVASAIATTTLPIDLTTTATSTVSSTPPDELAP